LRRKRSQPLFRWRVETVRSRLILPVLSLGSHMDPTVQGAIVGAGATVLAAVAAVLAVLWQVRHNKALEIKVELYKYILETSRSTTGTLHGLSRLLDSAQMQLRSAIIIKEAGGTPIPPSIRFQDLQDSQHKVSLGIASLIAAIEEW